MFSISRIERIGHMQMLNLSARLVIALFALLIIVTLPSIFSPILRKICSDILNVLFPLAHPVFLHHHYRIDFLLVINFTEQTDSWNEIEPIALSTILFGIKSYVKGFEVYSNRISFTFLSVVLFHKNRWSSVVSSYSFPYNKELSHLTFYVLPFRILFAILL